MLFAQLHAIAAPRGDGLRPELADMLRRSQARIDAGPKLVDLASYRSKGLVQSGPNPSPAAREELSEGVIPFPLGNRTQNQVATQKDA